MKMKLVNLVSGAQTTQSIVPEAVYDSVIVLMDTMQKRFLMKTEKLITQQCQNKHQKVIKQNL